MIRKIITISGLLIATMSQAQIHELGISVGASNFIGDIGSTDYIAPKDFGLGVVYRWNRSSRHSWKASYHYMKLSGDDATSDTALRRERNLKFSNNVHEVAFGIEFNFFEFDLHNAWFSVTPYIYTGIAGLRYDETHFNAFRRQIQTDEKYALAIPFSTGIKMQINKRLVMSAEVGLRYTFTDNLDGNHPASAQYTANRFGNLNTNDWYMFTGVTLTYTFGSNPCYCAPE